MSDQEILSEINSNLKMLISLLTQALFEEKPQQQKIKLLSRAGLKPKEIADLLGTTANTVSVALARIKDSKIK